MPPSSAPSQGRGRQERGRRAALVACALAAACRSTPPDLAPRVVLPPAEQRVEAWREDLAFLARELPRRHARPFGSVREEEFREAVLELDRRISDLDDAAVVVELARLCASVGDGHTGFHLHDGRLGFRRHPLWLLSLADGIFVKGALPPHSGALNGRVVRIGELPVEEARARLRPLVARDNEMGLRVVEAAYLTLGEVLVAIGATADPATARFVVVDESGVEHTLESRTLGDDERPALFVRYADGGGAPLSERLRSAPYAFSLLDGGALYVQVNACRDAAAFHTFCAEVFAHADALRPERLVIDLRWNAGGDSSVTAALYRALRARPWLRGRLVALIGPATFSSGMWAAIDLQAEHGAILVGEPTGGRPHAPGDARSIVLPRSTLGVGVSTRLWRKGGRRHAGAWVEPDVFVAETSRDHFTGRDPALEAALALPLDAVSVARHGSSPGRG